MRPSRLLTFVLWILLVGGSLWVYPSLPDQIPRHFGVSGQADAYWDTTLFRWLLLPLVALFSAALVYVPLWVVGRVPSSWINVSNQDEYDALPREKKEAVIGLVQQWMDRVIAATLIVFLAVQGGTYYVATKPTTTLPTAAMAIMAAGLFGILASVGWLVWALPRKIRRLSSNSGEG